MFRAASGEPVNASTFSRTWTPVRTKVGLPPRWGFHGPRHYYATLLIHAGASVKTVQLALGHSTPTITLNEFVHEWPDVMDPDPVPGRRGARDMRNGGHPGW
jgi:integrase